ncbi:hypothetical protein KX729_08195 [Rhizobium sp. XQZ8]|uniref:hypothetical protein n=1 Tax=Rhizobium populisoli TaxID=2859785 RepID=UPI001CA5DD03|nr:hypothetical protein [Rhizobium populisoli]MBW6421419.1 hypothetical protein [Rhizobium populisoli]
MADFVAVIRRAVDGLSNNTPEMRAKVYDKARGAVQRQLENMKPRPPEDMLRRQMEKLEQAILDVEGEHAEALPAEEDDAAAAQPVAEAPVDEPAAAAEHDAQPVEASAPEPVEAAAEEQPVAQPEHVEPESVPAPVATDAPQAPVFREDDYQEPAKPAEAVAEHYPETHDTAPVEEPVVSHEEQPVEPEAPVAEDVDAAPQQYGDWRDDVPEEEPVSEPAAEYREPEPEVRPEETTFQAAEDYQQHVEPAPAFEPQPAPVEDDFPYPTRGEQVAEPAAPAAPGGWFDLPTPGGAPQPVEPAKPVEEQLYDAPARPIQTRPVEAKPVEDWGWDTPAVAPAQQAHAAAVWDDVPELVPTGPVEPVHHGAKAEGIDAHFDTETHVSADAVRMPAVSELPDLPPTTPAAAAAVVAVDPFADLLDQHTVVSAERKQVDDILSPAAAPEKKAPADDNPWGDLEELIGFNKDGQAAGGARSALHTDADADDLMHAPAKPYRVTPVRKRNYAGIILAVVGLAVLGGGGYAVWLNRDSLNDMVDGLIESSLSAGSQTAQQAPAPANPRPNTPAPAANTPSTPATPTNPATPPRNNTASNTPAPASGGPRPADGATANTKFTQRLMADGSETDSGPGSAGNLAQNAEGQSVAQLNSPPGTPQAQPAAPATPAPGATAPVTPAPTTPAPATPAPGAANTPAPSQTPATTPAVAGEKMFLYEERIGQTAPTAIDGSVSWSLQREQAANGKQEPVIQGRITIPGRGLTALVTVKRNSDPSLPASHLIEIVFAVPPDFEGGAIDSVQRIAMKSTEQDRGTALIAVPAKITDDFHMIALNDFPDARATNLDLLRTRSWMDIPVAYRNGRRALLTLQKGTEGERVFNDAIREWGTLGPTASGQ